jgi:hypothetical protein
VRLHVESARITGVSAPRDNLCNQNVIGKRNFFNPLINSFFFYKLLFPEPADRGLMVLSLACPSSFESAEEGHQAISCEPTNFWSLKRMFPVLSSPSQPHVCSSSKPDNDKSGACISEMRRRHIAHQTGFQIPSSCLCLGLSSCYNVSFLLVTCSKSFGLYYTCMAKSDYEYCTLAVLRNPLACDATTRVLVDGEMMLSIF